MRSLIPAAMGLCLAAMPATAATIVQRANPIVYDGRSWSYEVNQFAGDPVSLVGVWLNISISDRDWVLVSADVDTPIHYMRSGIGRATIGSLSYVLDLVGSGAVHSGDMPVISATGVLKVKLPQDNFAEFLGDGVITTTTSSEATTIWEPVDGLKTYRMEPDTLTYIDLTYVYRDEFGVVPEPTTWLMMIAGFGLVGGALRRQRALASAV